MQYQMQETAPVATVLVVQHVPMLMKPWTRIIESDDAQAELNDIPAAFNIQDASAGESAGALERPSRPAPVLQPDWTKAKNENFWDFAREDIMGYHMI
jgi:hypothetical protein